MFLLLPFPSLFLLGPLLGLLALGRPATLREWLWLGLVLLLTVGAAVMTTNLAQELTLAAAAVFTGTLLALLVWRGGSPLGAAVGAAGLAVAVVAAGCLVFGLDWSTIRASVETQLQDGLTLLLSRSQVAPAQETAMRGAVTAMAKVYPGLAFLGALAGGTLAAAVAAHVSHQPLTERPGPLAGFRFNDHLIWGAVISLALTILPLAPPWDDLAASLLVVWAGVYLARGMAIWAGRSGAWPAPVRIALFLSAVLLLPYALGALLVLGLADTWIDIRRDRVPPSGRTD